MHNTHGLYYMNKSFADSFESLIKSISLFPDDISIEYEPDKSEIKRVIILVHPDDMRNIVGINTKMYRSLKTIIRSALCDFSVQLTVDAKK